MLPYKALAGLALLSAASGVALLAQGPAAANPEKGMPDKIGTGRYAMTPVEGGFLRMDTDTGMVALCAKKAAAWSCETVPDDAQAMRKETDRLAQENAELRRELAELRGGGPVGAPRAERKLELPSEEEIDKAIGQVDKYLRKFKGLIEKYQSPDGPGRQL